MLQEVRKGLAFACQDRKWIGLILLIAVLDQVTKQFIVSKFELHQALDIIPGLFRLVYVQNFGAAFGLFAAMTSPLREVILLAATLVALSVVFAFMGSGVGSQSWGRMALAMVCGGALGNLIDRARLGYVIDFLDFYVGSYHWPAFNLADSCICVGVALLVLLPKAAPEAA